MTVSIAIVHRDDSPLTLRADLFTVNRYGQVNEIPRQTHEIAPGVSAMIHFALNDVLVVRELPRSDGDVESDDADQGDSDPTAGDRA